MSVTATLPAPPETYLETVLTPATRHRVWAVGSGLGGMTATKALKHDLANIADAVVFLTRMGAQATSRVVNQPSPWFQVIPATAAVLAAVGVLITLYIAAARGWKKAPHRGQDHHTPMDALYSANEQRYEMATTASNSSCYGRLPHSRQASKGWV